jgi:GT2 family glycosyltransferase
MHVKAYRHDRPSLSLGSSLGGVVESAGPDDTAAPRSLSVVVVTYGRPEHLCRCLQHLADQSRQPDQVVVVDSTPQLQPAGTPPGATFDLQVVHTPWLAGHMTRARNEGLRLVRGDVTAFLDDDAFARPGWAHALLETFTQTGAAAVGGRTCNGEPGEEVPGEPVGRLLPDGLLTAGFAADLPEPVDIDHGIGANMAFRTALLQRLGGLRDDYPGTALREDTDLFLRVRAAGGRAVFAPAAVVDHVAAPHVQGQRFDARYRYYARRNHFVLLARNEGWRSPLLWSWVRGDVRRALPRKRDDLRPVDRARRMGVTALGLAAGAAVSLREARWEPLPPAARTARGRQ